jgi:acetolactate synthase-1/2/3 large subunit
MAEAIGQLTGRPAAVMGTRAVGAGNMAIGIVTARSNSTPMVALLGQVERRNRGREAFQESDLVASPGSLAKWAAEIDDPAAAPATISEGLRMMASGRAGPVLFSLAEDVLDLDANPETTDVRPTETPSPDSAAVQSVVDLLATAERPLILAGGGVRAARATDALIEFAEKMNVPVMSAWRRPDAFPNDHPLYLGVTGYGSAQTVRPRIESADALVVIGCRLNEIATYDYAIPALTTRWAHVDVEPRTVHAGLRAPDIAIRADSGEFLNVAVGMVGSRPASSADWKAAHEAYLAASVVDDGKPWNGPGVHPGKVISTLQRVLPADAILTTDAGNFGLWLARGYKFRELGTFLGSTAGAMGYGLPAAIAASLVNPVRAVIGMCGDGGLAMTMNEFETAVREDAHPIAICFDNRQYGAITMHQERRGGPTVATDLGRIDFAAVARACGALGFHVSTDAEFEPALRDAIVARQPAVIHLDVDQRWVSPDEVAED